MWRSPFGRWLQSLLRSGCGVIPGGRFLLKTMNKSYLLSHFRPCGEQTVGGVHITHRARWDERHSRIHDTWTMTRGRTAEQRDISVRVYNGSEMRALLAAAGFADIQLIGSVFGRTPPTRFTRYSPRLIAIARRPQQYI